MTHFVYILKCADTTLYVGCTNNVESVCTSITMPRRELIIPKYEGL